MRKLFTLLILMCCAIGMSAADYDIWVKGTRVTDSNKGDILGDGKVSFQVESSTSGYLVLNNANISCTGDNAIRIEDMSVYIRLKGTSTVTSSPSSYSAYSAIFISNSKVTISPSTGYYDLCTLNAKMTGGNHAAINLDNQSSLTIYDCVVNAEGTYGGICGQTVGAGCTLTVNRAKVTGKGGTAGIGLLKSLPSFSECSTTSTWNTTYNRYNSATVEIVPDAYNLYVKGEQVTSLNRYNILRESTSSVVYVPSTKTLKLKKATIEGGSNYGIKASGDLNVSLEGNSKITSSGGHGIFASGNLTVSGEGPYSSCLDVITTSSAYDNICGGNVTIKNCALNLNSKYSCISGTSSASLVLEKALLDMTASKYVFDNITSLTYTGCYLSKPTNAYYKSSVKGLTTNGSSKNVTVAETLIGTDNIAPTVVNKNISVSNITDTSCTVTWNPATDNVTTQDKLTYSVEYKLTDQSGWTLPDVGNATTYNITGLKPGKTYQLDICVHDETGKYNRYGEITFTTTTTDYDIEVGNTKITSGNCDDVYGDGKVSYSLENNELTLNGFSLVTNENCGIFVNNVNKSSQKVFKIKLIGTNKITHSGGSCGLFLAPAGVDSTLIYSTSSGSLSVTSNTQYATMYARSAKLTVKDCTLNMKNNYSEGSAIMGIADYKTKFSFINSTVTAETAGEYAITDIYTPTYHNCFISTPTDAYTTSAHVIQSLNGSSSKVCIVPGKDNVKPFFWENGKVTASDITETSCKIKWHYVLDNLTPSTDIKYHIFVAKEKATGSWVQDYDLDMEINSSALSTEIKNLIPGTKYIIRLRAKDKAGNLTFYDDLEVTTPVTKYNVWLAGTQVTSKNCNNILGDGKVEYTASNNTLTLKNATINTTEEMGIGYMGEEAFTIKLVGQNSLSATKIAVDIIGPGSITSDGSGSLTCSVSANEGITIATLGALTIENCTLTATSPSGYAINGAETGTLAIKNATVKANGKLECIGGFKDISLTDCYVDSPSGAVIDGNASLNNMGVYIGSYTVKDQDVVIKTGVNPHTIAPTVSSKTIAVLAATSSSLKLSWTAASDNLTTADKIGYVLGMTNKTTSAYKEYKVTGQTSIEITGLDEETEYSFTMRAYDEDGLWVEYDKLTAKTIKYVDTEDPVIPAGATIKVTETTPSSITISWEAPTDNITPADKLNYQIVYGVHGSETAITKYATGVTSFTIDGLDENTTYDIGLDVWDEAGNTVTYGDITASTTIAPDVTKPNLPTDATITATEVTKTSITISWNAASDDKTDAADLNYEVLIQKDGAWTTLTNLTGVTEYKIEGLEDMTEYKIAVYVSDAEGNEAAYDVLTISTAVGIDAILAENPDVKMYNTAGVLVGKNYRGVVVINGKKYMKTK